MAYRRKTYRRKRAPGKRWRFARRKYGRKGKGRNIHKTAAIVDIGHGFPKKIKTVLVYRDVFTAASVSGSLWTKNFCANGMFDPDLCVGGHQPYYFDQFMALYNHYCVIGAKITIRCTASTNNTTPTGVGIFVGDDTSFSGTFFNNLTEYPDAHYSTLSPAGPPITVSQTWSAHKWFGKSPLANSELQGTSTANPTEQSVFTLFMQSLDASTSSSVLVEVSLEQIVVFKELQQIAGS